MFKSEGMYRTPPVVKLVVELPRQLIFLLLSTKNKILIHKKQGFGRKNLLVQVILHLLFNLKSAIVMATEKQINENPVEQTAPEQDNILELTVKAVRVAEPADKDRFKSNLVFLTFDGEYEKFEQNPVTKVFEKVKTNTMVNSVGVTKAIVSDVSEDFALLMSLPVDAIVDKEQLNMIQKLNLLLTGLLVGSKVVIKSEFHAMGEVINGQSLLRDMMFNNILNVLPNERAKTLAKRYVDKAFGA